MSRLRFSDHYLDYDGNTFYSPIGKYIPCHELVEHLIKEYADIAAKHVRDQYPERRAHIPPKTIHAWTCEVFGPGPMPIWTHECDGCRLVGNFLGVDVYICSENHRGQYSRGPYLVARYSSLHNDEQSWRVQNIYNILKHPSMDMYLRDYPRSVRKAFVYLQREGDHGFLRQRIDRKHRKREYHVREAEAAPVREAHTPGGGATEEAVPNMRVETGGDTGGVHTTAHRARNRAGHEGLPERPATDAP